MRQVISSQSWPPSCIAVAESDAGEVKPDVPSVPRAADAGDVEGPEGSVGDGEDELVEPSTLCAAETYEARHRAVRPGHRGGWRGPAVCFPVQSSAREGRRHRAGRGRRRASQWQRPKRAFVNRARRGWGCGNVNVLFALRMPERSS